MAIKNRQLQVPLRREGSQPNPTLNSTTWGISAGRSSYSIWLWKTERIASEWVKGLLETREFLLRGSYIDLPIHKLTHSRLKCRRSSLKNTRDIQEGTKLSSFRVRAGGVGVGQCSPGQKWWQASLFLCWALLLPNSLMQVGAKSEFTINLTNTICSTLVIPKPCSTQLAWMAEILVSGFSKQVAYLSSGCGIS